MKIKLFIIALLVFSVNSYSYEFGKLPLVVFLLSSYVVPGSGSNNDKKRAARKEAAEKAAKEAAEKKAAEKKAAREKAARDARRKKEDASAEPFSNSKGSGRKDGSGHITSLTLK